MKQRKRNNNRRPVRRRRIKRRSVRIAIVLLIAVLILSALSVITFTVLSSLLKIKEIKVTGRSVYTKEQIIEVGGVKVEENLLAVNSDAIEKKIAKELPYTERVIVRKLLPDKLQIDVTAATPVLLISDGGTGYVINASCKVLEILGEENIYSLPEVLRKASDTEPVTGEEMPFASEHEKKIQVDIYEALSNNNILDTIDTIDLRDTVEIKMLVDGQYKVLFGNDSDIQEKIRFMVEILSSGQITDKGTIDVSNIKKASFLPDAG